MRKRSREEYLIRIVWSRCLSWNGFDIPRILDVIFDNYNKTVLPRRTILVNSLSSGYGIGWGTLIRRLRQVIQPVFVRRLICRSRSLNCCC